MRPIIIAILLILSTLVSYGQITINTNIKPNISSPIDVRMTIPTLGDTTTISFVYDGLITFVDDIDKFYYYQTHWREFQFGSPGAIDTVYASGDTLFFLSAIDTFSVVLNYIDSTELATELDNYVDGTGLLNQIAFWSSAKTLSGSSDLTYSSNSVTVYNSAPRLFFRTTSSNGGTSVIGFSTNSASVNKAAIWGVPTGSNNRINLILGTVSSAGDAVEASHSTDAFVTLNASANTLDILRPIVYAQDVLQIGNNNNSGVKAYKFTRTENKAAIWSVPLGSHARADIRFTTGNTAIGTVKTEADATIRIAPSGGLVVGNALLAQDPNDGILLVGSHLRIYGGTTAQRPVNAAGVLHYNSDCGCFEWGNGTVWSSIIGGSGTSGQVAFWNGASSQTGSSDLTFASSRLKLNNSSGIDFTSTAGLGQSLFPTDYNGTVDYFASQTSHIRSLNNSGARARGYLYLYSEVSSSGINFASGGSGVFLSLGANNSYSYIQALYHTGSFAVGRGSGSFGARLDVGGLGSNQTDFSFATRSTGTGVVNFSVRGDGSIVIGNNQASIGYAINVNTTTGIKVPVGTVSERPVGAAGVMRYNSEGGLEWHNGTTWATALESTFARGTATRVPFFNVNGQITDDATLTFSGGKLKVGSTAALGGWIEAATSTNGNYFSNTHNANTGTFARVGSFVTMDSVGKYTQNFLSAFSTTLYNPYLQGAAAQGRWSNFNNRNGRLIIQNHHQTTTVDTFNQFIAFHLTKGDGSVNILDETNKFFEIGRTEINANDFSGDIDFRIESDNDAYNFFSDAGTDRIGVGESAPLRKLHVNGDVRIVDLTTDIPTMLVGADADGDLMSVKILGASFSNDTLLLQDTHIGNTNLTLTGARTLTLSGNTLSFLGSGSNTTEFGNGYINLTTPSGGGSIAFDFSGGEGIWADNNMFSIQSSGGGIHTTPLADISGGSLQILYGARINIYATGSTLALSGSEVTVGNSTGSLAGDLRLREASANGANYTALRSPAAMSANRTITLPLTQSNTGLVLTGIDGAGATDWLLPTNLGSSNLVVTSNRTVDQDSFPLTFKNGAFNVLTDGFDILMTADDSIGGGNVTVEAGNAMNFKATDFSFDMSNSALFYSNQMVFWAPAYEFYGWSGSGDGAILSLYDEYQLQKISIKVLPTLASSWELTLPPNNGDPGQVFTTDGNGVVTWTTPAAGSNISNANLTLTANRTLTQAGFSMLFTGGPFTVDSGDGELRIGNDSISIITPDAFNITADFSTHRYNSGMQLLASDYTIDVVNTYNVESEDLGLIADSILTINAASGGSASFSTSGKGALEIGVASVNSGAPTLTATTGPIHLVPGSGDRVVVTGEMRVSDRTSGAATNVVGADSDGDLVNVTIGGGLALASGTLSEAAYTSDTIALTSPWTNFPGLKLTAYKQSDRVTIQGSVKGVVIPSGSVTSLTNSLPSAYRLTLGGFTAYAVVDGVLYPVAVQMVLGNIDVQSLSGSSIDLTGADDYLVIQNTYYKP